MAHDPQQAKAEGRVMALTGTELLMNADLFRMQFPIQIGLT